MKLTIAHKIIISICGVLAFSFLNSAFAIYSEYTAAKTSKIIGKNYINAYQQMEKLSFNTLTLQVNVLSYAVSLNENFFTNSQALIQTLQKNACMPTDADTHAYLLLWSVFYKTNGLPVIKQTA